MTVRGLVAAASVVGALNGLGGASPGATAMTITVTTTADVTNGEVSSVAQLLARPGPDGISLREGIEVTNNDPGTYTIRFAPALTGSTITLGADLPPLTGGGVTIEGSGMTLNTTVSSTWCECGLQVASSRNRLRGLTLERFRNGVVIGPYWQWTTGGSLPTHVTLADNVLSGLVLRKIAGIGIVGWSVFSPNCGAPKPERCWSYTTWKNTTITGNTIETGDTGIGFKLDNAGDRVDRATVTGNSIRIAGQDAGIILATGGDSAQARISDVLIARNTVEGSVDIGINVAGGTLRGQNGTVERVRVLDNRVNLVKSRGYSGFCCQGIVVQAGTDSPVFTTMIDPPRYLDGNVTRDVLVRGNSISGTLAWGVQVVAGFGAGGSRNRIENVRIEGNAIRSRTNAAGLYVILGDGHPFRDRYATGNRIARVTITSNLITIGNDRGPGAGHDGGVVLVGGGRFGRAGAIRDVRITSNRIATTLTGIKLVGGFSKFARGNTISCVRLAGNRITGARSTVAVLPNVDGARGNRATLAC